MLDIQRVMAPWRRKRLITNGLQHEKKLHFFLAVIKKVVYYVYMKVRVRKPIFFTKSRPHQVKTKIIHRKQKHKEALV